MKLVFLGPPGVGKGTYAKEIISKTDLVQISTGDLFRSAIKNQTELGKRAQNYINEGKLVPDEITINLIKEKIQGMNSFILDGFPRTIPQAEALSKITSLDKVVSFEAPLKIIIDRLSGRRLGEDGKSYHIKNMPPPKGLKTIQREDDKPEAIKKRLQVYENQTAPLKEYYKNKNILVTVDASIQDYQRIADETLKKIREE